MVVCLGWGADLHMAQLMPLPLTISCSSKSRLVLPSWYWLTRVVPDKIQMSHKTNVWILIQHATTKCTLKFKLYLLNHVSCFNKICRIPCVNTYIQSPKVWLKFVLPLLKYRIFFYRLFLLAYPVDTQSKDYWRQKNNILCNVAISLILNILSNIMTCLIETLAADGENFIFFCTES